MKYKRGLKTALISLLITTILLLPQYVASYNQLKEIASIKYELFACFLEFWALITVAVSYASHWFTKPWLIVDRDKRALGILQLFLSVVTFYMLYTYGHNYFEDSTWNVIYYLPGGLLRVLLSVVSMLLVGTDWHRVMKWWRGEYPKLDRAFSKTYLLMGPILSMIVLELLTASKVDGMLHRFRFITVFYFLLLEAFLYICSKKVRLSAILTMIVGYLIGVANYFVEIFRGNYITFSDLTVVRTALNVVGQYRFSWDKYLIYASIITLVFVGLAFGVKEVAEKRTRKQWGISALQAVGLLVFTGAFYASGYMGFGAVGLSWDSTSCMQYTGYLAYFISNLKQNQVYTIEGYKPEDIDGILGTVEGKTSHFQEKPPHIIVIMNEAFSDLSILGEFETNEDYLPFYHGLEGNHIQKGYLDLSVTVGPTSVTEFEFLTGVSMRNLPVGCLPYTQYLKTETSSLVSLLEQQDTPYQTIAFHPYYASGYNRTSVYQSLGFDQAIFYEDLIEENRIVEERDMLRGMLTDKANYREVIRMFEERDKQQPFFLFNVTIQNHGGYDNERVVLEHPVQVVGNPGENEANTYLSLIRQSDEALKELLSYFESIEEPVIVCMFGDHQPNVTEEMSLALNIQEAAGEDILNRYKVPFLLWTNYNHTFTPVEKISSNFLASYLVEESGIQANAYFQYLSKLQKEYPSVTQIAAWKQEENGLELVEQTEIEKDLNQYKKVSYNLIFDTENTKNQFFSLEK